MPFGFFDPTYLLLLPAMASTTFASRRSAAC
jgi:hypothetical protein